MNNQTLDPNTITLAEYLQVAFISISVGVNINVDEKIMYGGALYHIHNCVESIVPAEKVSNLNNKV